MSTFEDELPKRFTEPSGWIWGEFDNARGHNMRFGTLRNYATPRAHIVFIEGLSEFSEKNFELARAFNNMACNFSVFDRYGQGKSDRYFEDDRDKQHNEGVDHDIDDIVEFCRNHVPEGEPIVLLGNSAGGLLAFMALERDPELFKGAVLTAPLFGIKNPLVQGREGLCAKLPLPQTALNRYIPGSGPWRPRSSEESTLKPEEYSSDPERNQISDYWTTNDEELRMGGPTFGWVREMCRAIVKARAPSFLETIKQPVLMFTAGDECLVNNEPGFALVAALENGEHIHYEHGKHELLMETDDIRDDILSRTDNFLKNNI